MAAKFKIKKGDRVVVLTGRDKGRTGEVLRVIPTEDRLVVQGVNVVKRHQRPSQTSAGGIVEQEAKHVSTCYFADWEGVAHFREGISCAHIHTTGRGVDVPFFPMPRGRVNINIHVRADRDAYLRAGDARAPGEEVHEDRLAGPGSALSGPAERTMGSKVL